MRKKEYHLLLYKQQMVFLNRWYSLLLEQLYIPLLKGVCIRCAYSYLQLLRGKVAHSKKPCVPMVFGIFNTKSCPRFL